MHTSNLKSFNYLENGDVTFSIFDTLKSVNKLDAGSYILSFNNALREIELHQDKLVESLPIHEFPDQEKIDALFEAFFNKDIVDVISKLELLHKVGILLYGKEGTGKSTIIKYYAQKIIKEHNGIVFHITHVPGIDDKWKFITKIREIQNNPIVVIFDEFDEYFMGGYESTLKPMIDGKLSINNMIIFAATNYVERIPLAIRDRPSRFKYVLNIESIQNVEEVFKILKNMLEKNFDEVKIKEMSESLKGNSLDTIKQFGLDRLMDITSYPNHAKKKIGF